MTTRTEGHEAITSISDLLERAIERGDVALAPMPTYGETLGMTSYLITTTPIDRQQWLTLLALDDETVILTMAMLMYQMGYLRCMDDLRNERVVI